MVAAPQKQLPDDSELRPLLFNALQAFPRLLETVRETGCNSQAQRDGVFDCLTAAGPALAALPLGQVHWLPGAAHIGCQHLGCTRWDTGTSLPGVEAKLRSCACGARYCSAKCQQAAWALHMRACKLREEVDYRRAVPAAAEPPAAVGG